MFNDRYFTVEEMGQYLKVGRSTAYKLCKQPDFPTVRIGKKILVDRKLLDELWIPNKQATTLKGF